MTSDNTTTSNNISSNTPSICQHTFGNWDTVKQATCKEEGKLVRTCSTCFETEESTVSKTDIHTEVVDAAISATCTVDGKTEGKHCSICGKITIAQTTVKASGHSEIIDPAVSATCTQAGLTQGKHCSLCFEVIVVQIELPLLLHEYNNGFCKNCSAYDEIAKSAELLNEALRHEYAITTIFDSYQWLVELNRSRIAELKSQYNISYVYDDLTCYSKISEINTQINDLNYQISRLEVYNDPADRAQIASLKQQKTSLENQKAKYEAMRSINSYEDRILLYTEEYERDIANENNLYEQNKTNIELKYSRDEKLCFEHQWENWKIELETSCQNIGLKTRYCNVCKLVENDVADKLEHTIVVEKYIPATCTESGMTEGQYCSSCNTVLVAKEVISPSGHAYGEWIFVREASCALDGLNVKICKNCELEEKEFTPHLAHSYSQDNVCTSCNMLKPSEGLVYKLNSDNESYRLSSDGTCTDQTIIIARYYLGKPVISIADNAFYSNSYINTIIIPEGIETIGMWSFYGCTSLSSITMPSTLKKIERSAFLDCTSLETVDFSSSITTIVDYAFQGCTSLNSVTIPGTVTNIGKSIFSGCTNLTNVILKDGFTVISEKMFYNCNSLSNVVVPDSITAINSSAFEGCASLSYFAIPNNVTYIGMNAFSGCSNLINITLPSGLSIINSRAFYGCSNLTSIVLSSTITTIENYVFTQCDNLTTVYYTGTISEWNSTNKGSGNSNLTAATIYYYSETIPNNNDYSYWHYVDGIPTIWE